MDDTKQFQLSNLNLIGNIEPFNINIPNFLSEWKIKYQRKLDLRRIKQ